jgi:hypothetical protein
MTDLLGATEVFVPFGLAILLLVAVLWVSHIPQLLNDKLAVNTKWFILSMATMVWITGVTVSSIFWSDRMETLRKDIDSIDDATNTLKAWYTTYCACLDLEINTLIVNELHTIVDWVDGGIGIIIPIILLAVVTLSAMIGGTLFMSLSDQKGGHLTRMLTLVYMMALYSVLIGATAINDVFVYSKYVYIYTL